MKKYILLFSIIILSLSLVNCTSDEKTEGTIEGNGLEVKTLDGTIESTTTFTITDEKIPVKITLPQTFADTVQVEVSSFSDTGRRRRTYIDVMPNQTVVEGFATAAGGADGVYEGSICTFELTAINLQTTLPGVHYLIKSNVLSIATGDFSAPTANSSKLQLRLYWIYPNSSDNILNMAYVRPTSTVSELLNNVNVTGTNVTVSSTSGLLPGMVIKLASGSGSFFANTQIKTITSPTTFTVNRAPLSALTNVSVLAYGNDYINSNANSSARVITVSSTTGLSTGMLLHVVSGTGEFAYNTTISEINSSTTFTVNRNITTTLVGAEIMASFPDALAPITSGYRYHDLKISGDSNLAGSSTLQGDYVFKIAPQSLILGTTNLPYRLVIVKPKGEVVVYNGVYNNISLISPLKDIVKINKSGDGESAEFTITNLNP